MTSLALGSKLSSINARTRVAKAVANFLTGLPQKLVRTTRAGLATCIGPDGTLQWGPHNLLGESSNYETYTRTTGVSAPVSVAAPDGTPTACSITYDGSGTAGSYRFYASGPTPVSGRSCLVSVWLRSATPKTVRIYPNHGGYTTCNVTSVWTRFTCNVFNGNGFAQAQLLIYSDTGDNSTFTLEVAWGMIEDVTGTNRTTPSDYVDSTVKNRTSYSNDFVSGGAGWAKPAVNMYPAASTLADGTPMTLAVATAASAQHQFYVAAAAISGVATGQIMARDGGARYIQVLSAAVSDQYANFDLQTGAVTAKGAGCLWAGAVWINGAWCCSAQFNGTAATFYYSLANSPTAGWLPTFTGDGLNGVYIANACTLPGTGTPSYGAEQTTPVWTPDAGITVSGDTFTFATPDAAAYVTNGGVAQANTPYLATFTVSGYSGSGGVSAAIAGGSVGLVASANGTYTQAVSSSSTGPIAIRARLGATNATVSGVSFKPITYAPIPYSYNVGAAPAVGPIHGLRYEYDTSTVTGIGPDLLGGVGVLTTVANGTGVASLPGWTSYGTPTVAAVQNGALTLTANSTNQGGALFLNGLTVGKMYQMKLDVGGTYVNVYSGSWVISSFDALVGNGKGYTFVASATSGYVYFRPNGNSGSGTSTINNIIVQEAFAGQVAGYGPELAATSSWVSGGGAGSSMTITGDSLTGTSSTGSNVIARATVASIPGRTYFITGRLSALNSGSALRYDTGGSIGTRLVGGGNYSSTTRIVSGYVTALSSTILFDFAGGAASSIGTLSAVTVKEIIYAPKGALIEPTQATQLLANPDDLSNATNWIGNCTATDDGTKFRGRRFWKLTKTTTSTSEYRAQNAASQPAGWYTQRIAFLASPNSSQADFGLLGGTSTWGASDATCIIESGPGVVSRLNGAKWRTTGLSTNVPTVIVLTRNLLVVETLGLYVYPDTAINTTIGKAVYVQVDNLEAGTDGGGSFIPNPATSGTVVRVADTSSVGYDDLAKTWPWLMDTNLLANPDTPVTQSITTTAQQYTVQMQGTGTCTLSGTATGVLTGTGAGNVVTMTVTATAGTLTLTFAGSNTNGKINPGPVAQTYYPQSSKQGTIVFEGDLTYGSTAAVLFCLENTVSNRVLLYKPTAGNTLYGYINGNGVNSNQVITSGVPFKAAIGFSLASAGVAANGSSESAITPGAFALAPNVLKIANDATNAGSGSVRIRRLRIFNTNLPASTKQSLTR